MKKLHSTNFILAVIIIIAFIIFFRSLNSKEMFEDQTDDDSLIALQDFTKFATRGPPGEKGPTGGMSEEQKQLFKDMLDILVRKGIISAEEQIELQSHLY